MEFNLEKWQQGAKVRTRIGQEVTNLIHFPTASQYQLAGLIDGEIYTWTSRGKYDLEIHEHPDDLVLAEEEMWVNVFEHPDLGGLRTTSAVLNSKEEATKHVDKYPAYIGTYRLCAD